jgi:pyridoxamine 5'-phosphate oxidase
VRNLREDYLQAGLTESAADPDPIRQFGLWFDDALAARIKEPNAMTLATSSPGGAPDARMVLLKGFDHRGFVFFTNYDSAKARQLEMNPRAALVFYWPELERQVRISGTVARTSREETEVYFASRPRGSQLGAWTSEQSTPVRGRDVLEKRLAEVDARFEGQQIPAPPNWGGYRLHADSIEFWQGRPNRLHDRLRYTRDGDAWCRRRLAP